MLLETGVVLNNHYGFSPENCGSHGIGSGDWGFQRDFQSVACDGFNVAFAADVRHALVNAVQPESGFASVLRQADAIVSDGDEEDFAFDTDGHGNFGGTGAAQLFICKSFQDGFGG
jgi:hypothetical protein